MSGDSDPTFSTVAEENIRAYWKKEKEVDDFRWYREREHDE